MFLAISLTCNPPGPFDFGANWTRFLRSVNEDRIRAATASLTRMLGVSNLEGMRFLDAGCGSGLFSLAAHRLGASVVSIDIDPQSVACSEQLQERFAPRAEQWAIRHGSVLDAEFLESLGPFDVVYSWGVLHHTGAMWDAMERVSRRVADGGQLWIAIYNDQGELSRRWERVKRLYQRLPKWLRTPYVVLIGGCWAAWRICCLRVPIAAAGLLLRLVPAPPKPGPSRHTGPAPLRASRNRGMHWWYDLIDWIGGWPFETAKPEEVIRFLQDRGFELRELRTCGGGLGCNEFLFQRRQPALAP
jgi:2-polyprenyl-6-hydroxyphenyl methylase/3-demethylubiquinone-9 3-methyltransferase